jgi:ribosomal protein L7/L12
LQPAWQQPVNDDPPWLPEIRALVEHNRTIEAIKQVRGYTGWGLADAKQFVDRL